MSFNANSTNSCYTPYATRTVWAPSSPSAASYYWTPEPSSPQDTAPTGKTGKTSSWKSFLLNTASVILGGGLLIGVPFLFFRKRLSVLWEQFRGIFSLPAPWVSALRLSREKKWPEAWESFQRGNREFFYSDEKAKGADGKNVSKSPSEEWEQIQKHLASFGELADLLKTLQQDGLKDNLRQLNRNLADFNNLIRQAKEKDLLNPERLKDLNQLLSNLPSGEELNQLLTLLRKTGKTLPNSWAGYFLGLKPQSGKLPD